MADSYFQPSFFQTKGEFDKDDFIWSIDGTGIEDAIRKGVLHAMEKTKSVFIDWVPPLILFSQYLHQRVISCISQECVKTMGKNAPIFYNNPEGNQKSFFSFGDYVYVVAKGDVKKQNTSPNTVISEQLGDKHIITISYLIDETRESVVSLSLEYKKGKNTIFSHPIPLSSNDVENNVSAIEPQMMKPKFKAGIVTKRKDETV